MRRLNFLSHWVSTSNLLSFSDWIPTWAVRSLNRVSCNFCCFRAASETLSSNYAVNCSFCIWVASFANLLSFYSLPASLIILFLVCRYDGSYSCICFMASEERRRSWLKFSMVAGVVWLCWRASICDLCNWFRRYFYDFITLSIFRQRMGLIGLMMWSKLLLTPRFRCFLMDSTRGWLSIDFSLPISRSDSGIPSSFNLKTG